MLFHFRVKLWGARIDLKKELEFLLWLASSIEIVQKLLKFDYVCLNFLNKTSDQTWDKKSQTTYNLEWKREYVP